MKFNVHTHYDYENIMYVKNLRLSDIINQQNLIKELKNAEEKENKLLSLGIHPWDINVDNSNSTEIIKCIKIIKKHILHPKVFAIGECGLDKLINIPYSKQLEVFSKQLDLAVEFQKPVIIHSVRSYNEIIKIRQKNNYCNEWILHGYTGNIQIAEKLISLGCKISINKLKTISKKLEEVINKVPSEYIYYETDDYK